MASFNRVILMGNITRDVELKYLQSGTAVTEVGLAVNDRRKDAKTGQWVDETTFVDVTMWGRTAEIAGEYLSKGSSVLVEGRLKLDQWETDGQKRSKLRVVCENLRMLGGRGEKGGGGGGGGGARQSSGGGPQYDEGEYGGHEEAAPAPRRGGAPARSSAPPPPDDEIPF
jgi:single-strand DNA-binding protein